MKFRLLSIITIECKMYNVSLTKQANLSQRLIVSLEKHSATFKKTVYIPNTVEGNERERQTTGKLTHRLVTCRVLTEDGLFQRRLDCAKAIQTDHNLALFYQYKTYSTEHLVMPEET